MRIESYSICEVLSMLEHDRIRLPYLSRPYVWTTDDAEELFCTIFNKKIYGTITIIKQTDSYNIFEHKSIKTQGANPFSGIVNIDNPLYLVLDGYQRLQTLYYGLISGFDCLSLYFNVDTDARNNNPFKFYKENPNSNEWVSAKDLYNSLISERTYVDVANGKNDKSKENIFKFYYSFFYEKNVLLSMLYPNGQNNVMEDRKRFKRLFISLNTFGGWSKDDNPYKHNYEDNIKAFNRIKKIGCFFIKNPNFPNGKFNFKVIFKDEWTMELYNFVVKCLNEKNISIVEEKLFSVIESYLKLFFFTGICISYNYMDLFQKIYEDNDLKRVLCDYISNKIEIEGFYFDECTKNIIAYYCIIKIMEDFERHIKSDKMQINFFYEYTMYANGNSVGFPLLVDEENPFIWLDLDSFELKQLAPLIQQNNMKRVEIDKLAFNKYCGRNFTNNQEIEFALYKELDAHWNNREKIWNDYFNFVNH